ncbi:MAG TPA: hypothetical protein VGD78_06355 [Chthoniobacterales bacterium]
MITLPPKNDDDGVEVRLLLAECRGPSFNSYTLSDATTSMQLMDRVLWNRFNNPSRFGAKGAKFLADVIKAPGQFAGFQNYPNYDHGIANRIQAMLNIANSSKDKRSPDFADFLNAAITVSNDPSIQDPSPGILASWRTKGSSSPGSNFKLHTTVLGNDFYFIS